MLNAAAELKPGLKIKISQSSAGFPKQPCGDADLSKELVKFNKWSEIVPIGQEGKPD